MSKNETSPSSKGKRNLTIVALVGLLAVAGFFLLGGSKEMTLVVETQPVGAKVRLVNPAGRDDIVARDGLVRFEKLKSGEAYELSVSAKGYDAKSVLGVMPKEGDEHREVVKLSLESATISVQTSPRGANVFLDSNEVGVAPLVLTDIRAGTHSISATLNGYTKVSKQVEVKRGEKKTVTFELVRAEETLPEPPDDDLKPGYARLIVTSTHRSTFMVDNYVMNEGKRGRHQIGAGRHRITARAHGRDTKWQMIEAEEGKTYNVDFEFNEDPIEKAFAVRDPATPYHWVTKGMSIRNDGRYGEAVNHFKRALEIDPDEWRAHRQLGRTLPGLKRYTEAIYHNERYLELNPDSPDAKFTKDLLVTLRQKASEEIEKTQ